MEPVADLMDRLTAALTGSFAPMQGRHIMIWRQTW
jgi:hypothetical protein